MTRTLSPIRHDRITASRLPAVLGVSPYTTPAALMREMVREHFGDQKEFVGNVATEWGHAHEAEAVATYELTQGREVLYSGTGQRTLAHPEYTFLAATPDGLVGDSKVLEVKAPWRGLYTSIAERPDFYAQVQLQCEVLNRPEADLVIWRQDQPLIVETVQRDRMWFINHVRDIEAFMDSYWSTLADPAKSAPHREPLKDVRTDTEWAQRATEYLELDYLVQKLTAAREDAAAKLKALSPDKPAKGAGLDLRRFHRTGAVQYRKVVEDLKVAFDPNKYRGASAEVVAIHRIGAKEGRKSA